MRLALCLAGCESDGCCASQLTLIRAQIKTGLSQYNLMLMTEFSLSLLLLMLKHQIELQY